MIRTRLFALAMLLAPALAFAAPITSPIVNDSAGHPQDAQPVVIVDVNGAYVQPEGDPPNATMITASSGNVANASAVATLAGASGKTTYITSFQCTPGGATAAVEVDLTVVGVVTGTMTYTVGAPLGATIAGQPLVVAFPIAIPASAANTAIVVTMPALGTGNAHAACSAQGYRL